MTDHNRSEADRRVRQACSLIASAYRLSDLVVSETLAAVRSAIIEGAEEAAADVREEVERS